jgi:hypothetical protein
VAKLFRVRSVFNNFPHSGKVYDEVEVLWFVVHREDLSPSHEQVMEDYRRNFNNPTHTFESNLSELFTEEEAKALREYLLRAHKEGCEMREVDLSHENIPSGCGDKTLGNEEGYYRLDNEYGYDLPVVVWGYYNVSYAKDVSWLTNGMEFVERTLDRIGISITDKERLKSIIIEMKGGGLFVDRSVKTKVVKEGLRSISK